MKHDYLLLILLLFSCGENNEKKASAKKLCDCLAYATPFIIEMKEAEHSGDYETIQAVSEKVQQDDKMNTCKTMLQKTLKTTKKEMKEAGEIQDNLDDISVMGKVFDKVSPNCEHTDEYLQALHGLLKEKGMQ